LNTHFRTAVSRSGFRGHGTKVNAFTYPLFNGVSDLSYIGGD